MSINAPAPKQRPARCPVCGKPPQSETAPFCSRGCRDRDLLKWLGEEYRVPGPPAEHSLDDFPEKDGD